MSDALSSYDHVMQQPLSPTTRRRRLGAELRALRDAAGVTAETSAQELDCSVAKIRHIEGGRNAPSKVELKALVELYGGDAEVLAVLEEIRKDASKPGWWSTYRLPKWLQSYVGAETDARAVRVFQLEVIPGLLQTEAYARWNHEGLGDVDRRVRALTQRQERLVADGSTVELTAVISEGVLRRLSEHEFAPGQYRHLITVGMRPNINIRVLPFSSGLHRHTGGFVMLDFDPDVSMPACYFEYVGGGQLVDDQALADDVLASFSNMYGSALPETDSAEFIAQWI